MKVWVNKLSIKKKPPKKNKIGEFLHYLRIFFSSIQIFLGFKIEGITTVKNSVVKVTMLSNNLKGAYKKATWHPIIRNNQQQNNEQNIKSKQQQ